MSPKFPPVRTGGARVQRFPEVDGGSYDEVTLRRNRDDLLAVALRQRVLCDVSDIDLSTDSFGRRCAMPLALAPIGLGGILARRGEVQAARAAENAGVPFILSTVSACPIEEVARRAWSFRIMAGVSWTVRSRRRALPAIADAVGDDLTLLADGGVRSGLDVVRMLALGANGVLIGRAWAYALAGGGGVGVAHVLQLLQNDMRVAMALTGTRRIDDIDGSILA